MKTAGAILMSFATARGAQINGSGDYTQVRSRPPGVSPWSEVEQIKAERIK